MENYNRTSSDPIKRKAARKSKKEDRMLRKKKRTPLKINQFKYQSFDRFLKSTLKTSLITSIPEIAANKSWAKRIIKITVFIMCLIGFIYQTMNFLKMYWDYPTVVNVYATNPYEIVQPAVTICNYNRKRRTFICTLPDNECVFLKTEVFCRIYPQYCPHLDPKKAFTGFLKLDIDNRSNPFRGLLSRPVPFLAHKIWWTIHRSDCAKWENNTHGKLDALSYCAYSYFVREVAPPNPPSIRTMKTTGGLSNGSGIINSTLAKCAATLLQLWKFPKRRRTVVAYHFAPLNNMRSQDYLE
ncbi:hypothetical protein AVEN_219959-1 [Araneus ventricosus]|uniref:Uncharacterized protein n=1 Tax=Araneus ventricosus TaxID=182803 RepID=A0A4Y2RFG4_ARAVE|nr:hypothetical protein AVEN_219959-1 [Araneus ventricosus]